MILAWPWATAYEALPRRNTRGAARGAAACLCMLASHSQVTQSNAEQDSILLLEQNWSRKYSSSCDGILASVLI